MVRPVFARPTSPTGWVVSVSRKVVVVMAMVEAVVEITRLLRHDAGGAQMIGDARPSHFTYHA